MPERFIHSTSTTVIPGIGATADCGGSLLTLSIYAKQEDVVKAYLYWNGQAMRFIAGDTKTVLPRIFNMDYPGNRQFVESARIDSQIKNMKDILKDAEFDSF